MKNEEMSEELIQFHMDLRSEIDAYMTMHKFRQRQMAEAAGISLGLMNRTLKSDGELGEFFIKTLSENIEGFRGCYPRYLRLRAGVADAPISKEEAILVTREKRVEQITEKVFLAQQEVLRLLEELRKTQTEDSNGNGKVG